MWKRFLQKIRFGRIFLSAGLILLCFFLLYSALIRDKRLSPKEAQLIDRFQETPLSVCFLDVGQADCTVIRQGDQVMLIDCGDPEDADTILRQLRKMKIERIDLLVLTHPHSDHIGSAQAMLSTTG